MPCIVRLAAVVVGFAPALAQSVIDHLPGNAPRLAPSPHGGAPSLRRAFDIVKPVVGFEYKIADVAPHAGRHDETIGQERRIALAARREVPKQQAKIIGRVRRDSSSSLRRMPAPGCLTRFVIPSASLAHSRMAERPD